MENKEIMNILIILISCFFAIVLYNDFFIEKGLIIFEVKETPQGIKQKRTKLKRYFLFNCFLMVTLFEAGERKRNIYIRRILKKGKKYKRIYKQVKQLIK